MSELNNNEVASQVIARILEDAAFIFTDRLDGNEMSELERWNATGFSLSFTGERSGSLCMWADDSFARYAAANMLGIDENDDDAEDKGKDAMKEILNMVVGNFITALYGEDPIFDLGIPERLPDESLGEDLNSKDTVWLQAEGNPVLFVVKEE
ncbi:MAG: hypothetical protein GF401_06660 [Chitinivibrionales bacterium]|nr:hypothetical protein [Chitinivibrionales bacterium]